MLGLDLFCGAGGAGYGYAEAGLDMIGVDNVEQRSYPFTFWKMDAVQLLRELLDGARYKLGDQPFIGLSDIEFIHASPPCQGYTALSAVHRNPWPMLIPEVRELLEQTGKPWVIENVQGAPLRRDLTLCGEMFGLDVIRHRYFELGNFTIEAPEHIKHRGRVRGWRHGEYFDGPYLAVHGQGGGKANLREASDAMQIHWMRNLHEITEAIPPAYTRFIGTRIPS